MSSDRGPRGCSKWPGVSTSPSSGSYSFAVYQQGFAFLRVFSSLETFVSYQEVNWIQMESPLGEQLLVVTQGVSSSCRFVASGSEEWKELLEAFVGLCFSGWLLV